MTTFDHSASTLQWEQYTSWCRDTLGAIVHPGLIVRDLPEFNERGVFAQADLKSGEVAAAVPFDALLTVRSSLDTPTSFPQPVVQACHDVAKALALLTREDDQLAFRLLFEKFELKDKSV